MSKLRRTRLIYRLLAVGLSVALCTLLILSAVAPLPAGYRILSIGTSETVLANPDWLAGWSYRKPITVTNANADYQTKVLVGESSGATGEEVDCGGHVAADFDDLRFTAADGTTLLDYWIESITGTTPNGLATVWVQNNATPDTRLYMYYGGTETAVSSGANTFLWFDDFTSYAEDSDLHNQGGWVKTAGDAGDVLKADTVYDGKKQGHFDINSTTSGDSYKQTESGTFPFRIGSRLRTTSVTADSYHPLIIAAATGSPLTLRIYGGYLQYYNGSAYVNIMSVSINTWYRYLVKAYAADDVHLHIDDVDKGDVTRSGASGAHDHFGISNYKNWAVNDAYYDYFFFAKLAATEPSFAFGSEEGISPEITNAPDNWDFGLLQIGTSSNTSINYFSINNTGNCAVDITIQGTDATGGDDTWTLSDTATPGENIYGLKSGLDDADDNFDVIVKKTATYNTLVSNLAEDATQDWGLKIWMPTSLSGYDNQQMTGTITLVASEAA